MTPALIFVRTAASVVALVALTIGGFWAADRPGDVTLTRVTLDPPRARILATVGNPGAVAVLVGLSVRRCGLRLWLESGAFVSRPRRTTRRNLLAGRYAIVAVAQAGETVTFVVRTPARWRRNMQLVAAIGQQDRLRVIHQRVKPARSSRRKGPARTRTPVGQ